VACIYRRERGERVSKWTKNRVHGPMSWQEYATLGVEIKLDISKAKQELAYTPLISRAEGLSELRERFYLANRVNARRVGK